MRCENGGRPFRQRVKTTSNTTIRDMPMIGMTTDKTMTSFRCSSDLPWAMLFEDIVAVLDAARVAAAVDPGSGEDDDGDENGRALGVADVMTVLVGIAD